MPTWIVTATVFLGMLLTLGAILDWILRLRARLPRGVESLVWLAVLLGLPMCDRYMSANGDIWIALPPAFVLTLLSVGAWVDASRRARARGDN